MQKTLGVTANEENTHKKRAKQSNWAANVDSAGLEVP